ncbi:MAG: glycosyl hydrolase family 28-related protein [Lentisphaerota bacterium]
MGTEYRSQIDVKKCGAIGDGMADDTTAIQKALDGGQRSVFIPAGIYKISAALKVDSHTSIKADPRAVIRLADYAGTDKDVFLLTNRDHLDGNEEICVEGGVWDGNNPGNPRGPDGPADSYTGVALNFVNVRGLTLRGLTVRDPESFFIRLGEVRSFAVEDITLEAPHTRPNHDGVHLGGFCEAGRVSRVRGIGQRCPNDDMVAINADDDVTRAINLGMKCGPIRDIKVDDLQAGDAYTFVRLLSVNQLIGNISIDNVSGGCRVNAINLDRWRFPPGSGNIRNVTLRNFSVRKMPGGEFANWSNSAPLIPIQSAVHGLRIENFRREPVDDMPGPTLFIDNGRQNNLRLEGASGQQNGNKFVLVHGGFALLAMDSSCDGDLNSAEPD